MRPLYENVQDDLEIYLRSTGHISSHVHKSMECVYVSEGTLELGIGQNFYHMQKGDFALIFPDMIHHYQVFDSGKCAAVYLLFAPSLSGSYVQTLHQFCAEDPVIRAADLHPDILYAINSLLHHPAEEHVQILHQAFVQIILSRALPMLTLIPKNAADDGDIVYQTVTYIAAHFTEEVSLTSMAKDMGYSPFALSRVFSGTFHTNFNRYLNDTRLDYAVNLLEYTQESITDICWKSGFESQRTFNRAFHERFRMTPRDFRNLRSSGS